MSIMLQFPEIVKRRRGSQVMQSGDVAYNNLQATNCFVIAQNAFPETFSTDAIIRYQ